MVGWVVLGGSRSSLHSITVGSITCFLISLLEKFLNKVVMVSDEDNKTNRGNSVTITHLSFLFYYGRSLPFFFFLAVAGERGGSILVGNVKNCSKLQAC